MIVMYVSDLIELYLYICHFSESGKLYLSKSILGKLHYLLIHPLKKKKYCKVFVLYWTKFLERKNVKWDLIQLSRSLKGISGERYLMLLLVIDFCIYLFVLLLRRKNRTLKIYRTAEKAGIWSEWSGQIGFHGNRGYQFKGLQGRGEWHKWTTG